MNLRLYQPEIPGKKQEEGYNKHEETKQVIKQ
jgi:hypothetical protein